MSKTTMTPEITSQWLNGLAIILKHQREWHAAVAGKTVSSDIVQRYDTQAKRYGDSMADEFAKLWGLKLDGKAMDRDRYPCDDHLTFFLDRFGNEVRVSQPYDFDLDAANKATEFAKEHGLRLIIDPLWSWYYPGRTTALIWGPAAS